MKIRLLDPSEPLLIDRYGRPILSVWGGAGDADAEDEADDDTDEDDDEDDPEDDPEDDEPEAKKKPPAKKAVKKAGAKKEEPEEDDDEAEPPTVSQEKYNATRSALRASRAETRAIKKDLAALRKTVEEADKDKDGQAARRKLREEIEEEYKPIVVNAAARSALVEAGAKREKVGKLIRLLDHSELTVDAKGGVDGLEEQIEDLQDEFPELFGKKEEEEPDEDAKKNGRRTPKVNTGSRRTEPKEKELNMTQRLMRANRDAARAGGLAV